MWGLDDSANRAGPPAWKLEPGTMWLYNIDGILWPVILLDEEFLDEGEQNVISTEIQPVLRLGHHNLIWAETAQLLDFDESTPFTIASDMGTGENSMVSLAFSEAFRGGDMLYWRGLLESEKFARQFADGGASPVATSGKGKGKGKSTEIIDLAQDSDKEEEIDKSNDIQPFTSNQDFATIIIGKDRVPIIIPFSLVKSNRHLSECVSLRKACDSDTEQAIVVSRRAFEEHRASTFRLIATWMRIGHYRPPLDDKGRFLPVLRGELRVQEMIKLGQVLDLAREMMIYEIFEYLWKRYKALKPWPPEQLLQLITIVWRRPSTADESEVLLRLDLAGSVAREYDGIVADDGGSTLHDLFARHPNFAKAVFDRRYAEWVKDNPDEDDNVDGDDEMNETDTPDDDDQSE